MLQTYADETGDAPDPAKHFVGLAGFVGWGNKWKAFDAVWRQICEEESIVLPFHMADFAACSAQFKPWKGDEVRRQRALDRLVTAILDADVCPIGAIVSKDDFDSLNADQRERLGGNPYYVAFQEITHQMAFCGALQSLRGDIRTGEITPIPMFYAKKNKYTGKAIGCWEGIKEANLYGAWMGSFTPAEMIEQTPLQAADLWAYELGHHFECILPENRPWRYAHKRIVTHALRMGGGHRFFELCTRKFMLGMLGELEEEDNLAL